MEECEVEKFDTFLGTLDDKTIEVDEVG